MADEVFALRSNNVAIPTIPRFTGDYEQDVYAIQEFFNSFITTVVVESGLVDPIYQASGATTVDVDNPADPAQTTLAIAQETANQGIALTQQAQASANSAVATADEAKTAANTAIATADQALDHFVTMGTATISHTDTAAVITFASAEADTNYRVATCFTGSTGTPPLDAFHVVSVTKTTADATLTLNAAPGSGNSVILDYIILR